MKKLIALALCLVFVLSIAGCGNTGGKDSTGDATSASSETNKVAEVKEPTMKWWKVYNPNGFNTFIMKVKNENSVDVDFECDVTYMKDGKEVGKSEGLYVNALKAGEEYTIWYNFDIPDSADDIKVEYTYLAKSKYVPIDVSIVKSEKTNDGVYIEFKPESTEFPVGTVEIVYYDSNKEPLAVYWADILSTDPFSYTFDTEYGDANYEILTNFYK